ncbi:TetR/AcrR family transcriptional regulator [Salaquimonas pukyongi]|uniref:TetR/AcrR family transcriptional regulator n=1 Tax=Salaquimonas pukyongi TaxID=2712698 RepID=UPI00096B91AF|nr:TetR/AcrR family transcriptional regulator [Salaquimonas pukyongi]
MARTAGSRGEETALRVREAALRLFADKGYAAVSMREIAAEVGLQAGALYNHFPTKQAILVDLLETHMVDLIAAWEGRSHTFSDPVEALIGFVRFHIRYHLERQDAVFISYMELRNLERDGFERIEELRRVYEGFLRKIIQIGAAKRVFAVADIPVAAMAVIAMLTGVNTWFRSGGRLKAVEIEEIYVKMVLGSLGHVVAPQAGRVQQPALQGV